MDNRETQSRKSSQSRGIPQGSEPPPPPRIKVMVSPDASRRRSPLSKDPSPEPETTPPPASPPVAPTSPVRVNILVSPHPKPASPPPSHLVQAPQPLPNPELPQSLNSVREEEEEEEEWEDEDTPIKVLVSPKDRSFQRAVLFTFLTLAFWAGMATLVGFTGWTALRFILNPGSVSWLRWVLPDWQETPLNNGEVAQTFNEIRANLAQDGHSLGEPFPLLDSKANVNDLLVPVLASSSCSTSVEDCQSIIELRVYRPSGSSRREPAFRLIDRLTVRGPQESFVIAPLVVSTGEGQGSTRPLPLTDLDRLQGNPPAVGGIWLQIRGEWVKRNSSIFYGQILRYDTTLSQLDLIAPWTSPAREAPAWQDVTAGGSTELVVNQTVGLEPNFQIYQVRSLLSEDASVQLTPISLSQPALKNHTYEEGILLARSGLWNPSLQVMRTMKQRLGNEGWSLAAQAQMDLIAFHAAITKAQAERDWGSPSQQLTALLIDGRWSEALALLEKSLGTDEMITTLLRDSSGRIWKRVGIALQLNRNQSDVQAWGAAIVATRQGRNAAIAWLQQYLPRSQVVQISTSAAPIPARIQRILSLLDSLPSSAESPQPMSQPRQLLGIATPLATVNASDWLRPQATSPLTLENGQSWYRVQVTRYHDGQTWRRSPFTHITLTSLDRTHQLWTLFGFANDPTLQLTVWTEDGQSQTLSGTIRGVQFRNGTLTLLAAANQPDNSSSILAGALAMTTGSLSLSSPTGTMTLFDLNLNYPNWTAVILPILQQEVPLSSPTVSVSDTSPEPEIPTDDPTLSIPAELSDWLIQFTDLTGDDQSEVILSSNTAESSKIIILSDQGELLYRDEDNGERVMAIAHLPGNPLPFLITHTADTYRLKQWSTQSQQFE